MTKEIKGYCIQKGKPNPNKSIDIETKVIGKNLFEVNEMTYTDNIPNIFHICITKEQYIEYEQLKEENKQLKEQLEYEQNLNEKVLYRLTQYEDEIRQLKERIEELEDKILWQEEHV